LVPKAKKGKETVLLCQDCGRILHQFFENKDLKNKLNTIELIRASPKMKNWIAWISKKSNSFGVCMARKK